MCLMYDIIWSYPLFILFVVHNNIGFSFVAGGINKKQSIWMILFLAILTPSGQILGMYLNSMSKEVQGVFMAISAGTFLYIATAEIIIEEFSFARYKYLKFLLYSLGVLFIALITAYA